MANTAAGASAFVRFYFASLNEAFRQPGAATLADLRSDDCVPCRTYEATVRKMASSGLHAKQEPFTLNAPTELPESTTAERAFQVLIVQRTTEFVNENGQVRSRDRASKQLTQILARRYANRWKVADIALAPLGGEP
jgi:hypothetical protein